MSYSLTHSVNNIGLRDASASKNEKFPGTGIPGTRTSHSAVYKAFQSAILIMQRGT